MDNRKNKKNIKILVAMSGGVDSSVVAQLLKNQGYQVAGVFLHFWKEENGDSMTENKCCSTKALFDARIVCNKIGIPFYTMNFSARFKKAVVDDFLEEYGSGNTPNPCVRCNKLVKLGFLLKKARELGFDFVASGHYAKIKQNKNKFSLWCAKDKKKDQSYFLYTLNQSELAHLKFPLAGYTKDNVRALAKKFKLPTAEKKESQEICFIPGKSHNDFLRRYLKLKRGEIKTLDGKVVGKHEGLPLYTVGQRKGIEIGGTGPYYAVRLDYKNNILFVTSKSNDPILFNSALKVKNLNWISGKIDKFPLQCEAVIRYHQNIIKCEIFKIKKSGVYDVRFAEPQRAIAPGQSIVFYSKEKVLGGGVIV